ncbi:MAG: cysteine desulfurase family protein [Planctomycetota bacterium]
MAATAPIYLDHNATSPLAPAAAEAMRAAWESSFANPASQHAPGRSARRTLEAARDRVVSLLGGEPSGRTPDRLVFTSGGTESNVLALRGLLAARGSRRLVVSAIEHPSVAATADRLEAEGFHVDRLPVDGQGVVRVAALESLLDDRSSPVGLVSVMTGSNETGVVQPIERLAAACREAGALLHTDAVQAVGKHPVRFREWGVSALTFTAHKFHGPLGVGSLLLAPGVSIEPVLTGGFQQQATRPGTESAPLAAGLLAALDEAEHDAGVRRARLASLRDRLQTGLLASWPGAVALGVDAERLPHACCVAFPGADRQALVMAYDLAGVACSSGSACASGSSEPSPTLRAMGLPEPLVRGAVRFAVGAFTTDAEIDEAAKRIAAVNARLRAASEAVSAG